MNEWAAHTQDHRVWNDMKTLGPSIDEAIALPDIEPSAVEALERVQTVLAYSGKEIDLEEA